MRARGAAIQGGLAGLGLLFAYTTWQRPPERAPGEAIVVDVTKSDLRAVKYDDGSKWVELTRQGSGDDAAVWLHLSAVTTPPAPERMLRGNAAAEKLFESFAPLHAPRALGVLEAAKLKELGLDASKRRLEVEARGERHGFVVATPTSGGGDPYVKDEASGRVFMLARGVTTDLDSAAARLVDRNLHSFKPADYDRLTVSSGGKTRELIQTAPNNPAANKLAPKRSPDKPDELAKNWHDKVSRLFATEVLGKGEAPKAGEPTIVLRVDYFSGKRTVGFLELGKLASSPPPPPNASTAPPASAVEFYARTEHTAGWAKLTTTEELLKEGEKVAAAE